MGTKRMNLILLLMAMSLCLATACKKDKIGAKTVFMENNMFDPLSVTISAGTAVTWTNKENATHSVTSDDGIFESGDMEMNDSYTFTFVTAGTYKYHCSYHTAIKGRVEVR